jgi:nicotinate-nucleotide adenylyltransferase
MLDDVRTGILGGTFDPIHIAHLHAAESARYQLDLDRVLIIPAGDPWQKAGRSISPGADRIAMCRLAVDGVEGLEVDDREVTREGPTYTIDTLQTFPADEELVLIVGSDSAAGLETWHRWRDIVERATLAVVPRPGPASHDLEGAVPIVMGLLEISGTDIRERARSGRPFRYLVTRPVYDYVIAHDLYTDRAGDDIVGDLERQESPS